MAKTPPKDIKPPNKRKKNVAKTSTSATNLANPSANLRNKLQDKVKHTAVLVQEITELLAIEEESLNNEHNSEATQESDLEQEDSDNHLTDDDQ